ncbi:MAG: hypothetical protein C0606_01280 [Hyphomicrobiales bacterium]|nr:MAG: hypothetical protein C0606_01280 [Hyphomicrobiales bacterium]
MKTSKKFRLLAAAAAIGVAMTLPGGGTLLAADDGYTVISKLETFNELLVGPRITDPKDEANFFVVNNDGTLNGTWHGKTLTGTWRWDDAFFCRVLTAPRPAPEDCQQWALADDKARLVRERGTGKTADYVVRK